MTVAGIRRLRSLRDLLLAGDRAARTLLRARVRMRALTADRQTLAMADATVGADVHQSLDVHRDFGAERAFDLEITVDHLAKLRHVGVGQITNPEIRIDTRLLENLAGTAAADSKNVRQSDLDLLLSREIDARNTSHE